MREGGYRDIAPAGSRRAFRRVHANAGFQQFSEVSPIAALGVAFLVSIAVLPFVRRFAIHQGLLDQPDELRRKHSQPVPRLGGIGVFAGVLVVSLIGALLDDSGTIELFSPFVISVFVGATILFITGLVDDVRGVSPLMKIVAQSVAATVVYRAGFSINSLMILPNHVRSATRPDGAIYALSPIFALAHPLLDTGISMPRRWLRGEPLSRADARHIHHQLVALGLGPRPRFCSSTACPRRPPWSG